VMTLLVRKKSRNKNNEGRTGTSSRRERAFHGLVAPGRHGTGGAIDCHGPLGCLELRTGDGDSGAPERASSRRVDVRDDWNCMAGTSPFMRSASWRQKVLCLPSHAVSQLMQQSR